MRSNSFTVQNETTTLRVGGETPTAVPAEIAIGVRGVEVVPVLRGDGPADANPTIGLGVAIRGTEAVSDAARFSQ